MPDIELTAIVPAVWRDRRGDVSLDRAYVSGYRMIVAPVFFNGRYHLHFYPTLQALLRVLRPDVLHVDEEPYNFATWHALRIGESVGARGLFFSWQNLQKQNPWPFSALERANYRRASHAIVGNQAAAAVLRAKGYRGPTTVIPQFGVDPAIFTPAAGENRPEEPYHIGYAGALIPEKGVDLLLRACAGLTVNWKLSIAGAGPERARLESLATGLGVQDRVCFLGHLPSTGTPAFYRQLAVLVLPSLTRPNWVEQFGRVLIEAMACGVAVVGSATGEIPNVIGDAGIIYPEGSVDDLRQALAELALNPARRCALAGQGRARVLEHFTMRRVAEDTYAVYQMLI